MVVDRLIANANALRILDAEVLSRHAERLGCVLIDMTSSGGAIVHARDFLRDHALPAGLRVLRLTAEALREMLDLLEPAHRYVVITVNDAAAPMFENEPTSLVDLVQARSLPWFPLELGPEETLMAVQNGRRVPVRQHNAWAPGGVLPVSAKSRSKIDRQCSIPFALNVKSQSSEAQFELEIGAQELGSPRYELTIRRPDLQPLGEGQLRVDVQLEPGHRDAVIFSTGGFSDDVIELVRRPPQTPAARARLVLHILFDRTTIDAEHWLAAYRATAEPMAQPAESLTRQNVSSPEDAVAEWNRGLRAAVINGLTRGLARQKDVTVDLWTFADEERSGTVAIPFMPTPRSVFNRGDHNVPDLDHILDASGYMPGLDVYDAVDEALEGVTTRLTSGARHAVLIVGDSPPPPQRTDSSDRLWAGIGGAPERTNARKSDRFMVALASLQHAGVPIEWVFVKTARWPTLPSGMMHAYERYHSLRERVLTALRGIPHMQVTAAASADEVRELVVAACRRLLSTRDIHGRTEVTFASELR